MTIHQYRVVWGGGSGLPGYTLFNFSYPSEPGTAPTIVTALDSWCNSVRTTMPSVVTIKPDQTYKVFNTATGELIDELADAGTASSHAGAGTGVYNARAGACISLKTTTIAGSRKVRGRIFIVPLAGAEYSAVGRLASGVGDLLITACNTLKSDTSLAPWSVWHRPILGAGGVAAPITGFAVNDEGAVLKTRAE